MLYVWGTEEGLVIHKSRVTFVERIGPRRSVRRVPHSLIVKLTTKTTKATTNVQYCSARGNYTKTRSYNRKWEKGLPKYDLQSETTIDSCL